MCHCRDPASSPRLPFSSAPHRRCGPAPSSGRPGDGEGMTVGEGAGLEEAVYVCVCVCVCVCDN